MEVNDRHYSVLLEWDPRDSIYVATVRELLGCVTHGKTYEEAIAQVQDAMAGWLEIAEQQHEVLPDPILYDQTP